MFKPLRAKGKAVQSMVKTINVSSVQCEDTLMIKEIASKSMTFVHNSTMEKEYALDAIVDTQSSTTSVRLQRSMKGKKLRTVSPTQPKEAV